MVLSLLAACGSSDGTGLFNGSTVMGEGGTGAIGGDAGMSIGGAAGTGPTFDASAGSGGASGFAGTSGSAGTGGSADTGTCDLCADQDSDGHGDPNRRTTDCNPGSGWVTVCDDCHDANAEVFPGSTICRGVPYVAADGITSSFDYDCNGAVSECMEVPKASGSCQISGFGCSGSGYLGPEAGAGDAGDLALYCGSTQYRTCNRIAPILCTAATETRAPVECR
jgi:hypothetical protein